MLLVWCHLLTGYEPGLVRDNLRKMVPRPPLPVVQVHGEGVSPKGREFEPLSVRTLYTCGSVAGRSRVRESVRYITHDSCAISVVPPFNNIICLYYWLQFLKRNSLLLFLIFNHTSTFNYYFINLSIFYLLYHHVSFHNMFTAYC